MKLLNWVEGQVQHKRLARVCIEVHGAQARTIEPSVLLLLTLLMGFLLLLIRGHWTAHGHLSAGPCPLPLLGNLLQIDRRGILKSFMQVRHAQGLCPMA